MKSRVLVLILMAVVVFALVPAPTFAQIAEGRAIVIVADPLKGGGNNDNGPIAIDQTKVSPDFRLGTTAGTGTAGTTGKYTGSGVLSVNPAAFETGTVSFAPGATTATLTFSSAKQNTGYVVSLDQTIALTGTTATWVGTRTITGCVLNLGIGHSTTATFRYFVKN